MFCLNFRRALPYSAAWCSGMSTTPSFSRTLARGISSTSTPSYTESPPTERSTLSNGCEYRSYGRHSFFKHLLLYFGQVESAFIAGDSIASLGQSNGEAKSSPIRTKPTATTAACFVRCTQSFFSTWGKASCLTRRTWSVTAWQFGVESSRVPDTPVRSARNVGNASVRLTSGEAWTIG